MNGNDKRERLTRRDDGGGISIENLPDALERLAAYEDAEPLDFSEAMSRATPKKPILRNSDQYQCELNVCPTCGHIVEGVESMEPFAYCPGCGQRIDWDGAAKDASGGTEGGAAP